MGKRQRRQPRWYDVLLCLAALAATLLAPRREGAASAAGTPLVTATAAVSSGSVPPGQNVQITATFSTTAAIVAMVDVEIYTAGGKWVFQRWFDNQPIAANTQQMYQVSWPVDASTPAGKYVVKLGVMAPKWGDLYTWNDAAATVSVVPAGAPQALSATLDAVSAVPPAPVSGKLFGVSVAAAEFGDDGEPLGLAYTYAADTGRQSYFAGKGLTLVRIPFRWERVQPAAFGPLSDTNVAGLRAMLDAAQAAGQKVILDLHNYGTYRRTPLTRADAPKFADAWKKLAQAFGGHPALYGYELMNEPHDLPGDLDTWMFLAQSATDAIRQVDTNNWVLVPGYSWQSASFWSEHNATLNVQDPTGKLLYAAHLYFDASYTGAYEHSYDADGTYPTIGVDRLQPFLHWLASHNAHGILTEYGIPSNDPRWLPVLDNLLAALNNAPSIQGGVYWASGPWWGGYSLSVEPSSGQDRPQMAVLSKYPSKQ